MPIPLLLADAETAADAQTFASRAARVGDGAVRLRADAGVLAMTCAPIAPRGLLDSLQTIQAMRVLAADPEVACDLVVDANALRTDGSSLLLPDTASRAAWAGVSAPASGWVLRGEVRAGDLAAAARRGMSEVTSAIPTDAGDDVVHRVRAQVWGAADPALGGLPAGAGFVAQVMGFLADEDESAPVRSVGSWARVSLRRGHVLVRGVKAVDVRGGGHDTSAR